MKTESILVMCLVAATLTISTNARADTLPAGAVRFDQHSEGSLQPVDVPSGKILVITDIITLDGSVCVLLDGPDWKIFFNKDIHLQTGVAFTSQLHARDFFPCYSVMISGYWLDAPQ